MTDAAMTDAQTTPIGGDWNVRGLEPEQKFAAINLSDDCVDAANRAQHANPNFPGWHFYSRIVRGDTCFDRQLAAYAIGLARAYSRARKLNGHAVIAPRARRNLWVAQAGIDALEFVIAGRYSATAMARAEQLDVRDCTFSVVRNTLVQFLLAELDAYRHELHYRLARVEAQNRRARFFDAIGHAA